MAAALLLSSSACAFYRRLPFAPHIPRSGHFQEFHRVRQFSPAAMSTSSGPKEAPANNPGLQVQIDPATKGYFLQQTMVNAIDWTDVNTTILCELLAEQVDIGNRPNTHLNTVGYTEVTKRFKERTGLELCRNQIKNKWDKMKVDFGIWNKLLLKQTGIGWDHEKGTIDQDSEWWEKAKKEIVGCGKFKRRGLQNEDLLKQIFRDITNDGGDHWNHMRTEPPHVDNASNFVGNQGANEDTNEDEVFEVSPSSANGKRCARPLNEKGKLKTSTAIIIQEKISKIADSASSMVAAKSEDRSSIKDIMELVVNCGATYGSNEHFIASELFVKREQRDMFMTLPTSEIKFDWLSRKYSAKYGQQ